MAQLTSRYARAKFIPLDRDPDYIGGGEARAFETEAFEPQAIALFAAAAESGPNERPLEAQSLTTSGMTFTQNFNSLVSTGTGTNPTSAIPFEFSESSGNTTYTAGTGSANAGDTYSFGAAGSTDRALGTVQSGSNVPTIGASFTNDTGATITSLLIAYTGEQWRLGTSGRNDRLDFQISFNATSLTTGTWTDVNGLDFVAPVGTGTVGALDGNAAANRTAISFDITGQSIAAGTIFWIRWLDFNASGADDGLAIDDFSLTATSSGPPPAGPGALSITDLTAAEGSGGSTTPFVFTVTRPAGSVGIVTVDYAVTFGTGAGQADAADFSGLTTGTLTFANGDNSETITLNVVADTVGEPNEAFTVTLSNPTGGATIAPGAGGGPDAGLGSITNDDISITTIMAIQGAQHTSPMNGMSVTTRGIVTAVDSTGFYLQDATGDGNVATSDAIFVFTSSAPTVSVGQDITFTGTVSEFFPGGAATGNLSTTQLTSISNVVLNSSSNPLPPAIILGPGGRLPPTENIEDDNFTSFDPATDGIDFYESLEGMLVHVPGGTVVAPTTSNGEIFVVTRNNDGNLHATNLSSRGTLNVDGATGGQVGTTNQGPGSDFNPERIQIDADSTLTPGAVPQVDVGAVLNGVTGVITYNFGNFEIAPTSGITVASPSTLTREVTSLLGTTDRLSVASYNVENLDPTDGVRFATLAQQIETNLGNPDIIALQEVQDNDGPGNAANSTVVSADVTLQRLVDAIFTETGIRYAFIDNPFIADDKNGGEPGGNIRNAFLYRTDRVSLVEGSVTTTLNAEQLSAQRTDASSPFFASRVPLVATFTFRGEDVTVIDNHFASKGGSTPLFGTVQPSTNSDEGQRQAQAQNVADYVASLASGRDIVVLGDLNEFETEEALIPLSTTGGLTDLINNLPEEERYSFIFDGNSQQLDHLYVSQNLVGGALIDIVHVNTEFAERPTDHDPSVATLALTAGGGSFNSADTFTGTSGNDTANGDGGNDFFFLQQGGNDTGRGGSGDDSFYFGAALTSADVVDGGAGTNDQIGLQGDYTGARAVTLGNVTNIEVIVPLPGNDTRFGDTSGASYSYMITTSDVNVASGATLVIDAARLRAGENVNFNGSAETNGSFFVYAGVGVDTYRGGAGNDLFLFRQPGGFTAADSVDGGAGTGDQLGLRGDYAGANALVLGAATLINAEAIVLLSGQDARFNSLAFGDFSYDVTSNEATVAAGAELVVDAGALSERESLRFDGSAETNGTFRLFGGSGDDTLIGGQGADLIRGNLGADRLDGRGGADVFQYRAVAESTASRQDTIDGFVSGQDRIDLSQIDANTNVDGNNDFAFIGSNMFSGAAGELRAVDMGNGRFTVEGDVNGDGAADFVLSINMIGGQPVTMADFIV